MIERAFERLTIERLVKPFYVYASVVEETISILFSEKVATMSSIARGEEEQFAIRF